MTTTVTWNLNDNDNYWRAGSVDDIDIVYGNGGHDNIGDDSSFSFITGDILTDTYDGGSGNDIIVTKSGNDDLLGRGGEDYFDIRIGSHDLNHLRGQPVGGPNPNWEANEVEVWGGEGFDTVAFGNYDELISNTNLGNGDRRFKFMTEEGVHQFVYTHNVEQWEFN